MNLLKFEFATYTEVTDLAFDVNKDYKRSGYVRVFLCPDVHDVWIARILKDFNEDYLPEKGSFILERQKIPNRQKGESLTIPKAIKILREDDFENWDFECSSVIPELVNMLDGGFGILNLREEKQQV